MTYSHVRSDPANSIYPTRSPVFPEFKPLALEDKPVIEAFTRQFKPYSDFCFTTLFFFDVDEQTRWCWLNGNLVLRFCDHFGPGIYLTFLGRNHPSITAKTLIDYAVQMGFTATLWRIPETTALSIGKESNQFLIEEDRDAFDYVYCPKLADNMEGSAYYNVRSQRNRFKKNCPDHSIVTLDLNSPDVVSRVQGVLEAWRFKKDDSSTLNGYCRAFEKCLRHMKHFNLPGYGIIINNSLEALQIYEPVDSDWLMAHFWAFNPMINGLSYRLHQHMAHIASRSGHLHLNLEEDLGDEGLRNYKTRLLPSGFLRKFSVKQHGDPK